MGATTTGRKTYNNGIIEKSFFEGQQPEGWVHGRLLSVKKKIGSTQKEINEEKGQMHFYEDVDTGELRRLPEKDVDLDKFKRAEIHLSEEQKEKCSRSHQGLHHTEEAKKKISEHSNNNREKAYKTAEQTYGSLEVYFKMVNTKANETKRKNGTFNSSKPETAYYNMLCEQYGKKNIKRHYKSKEYPYYCDFYIIPENKYIELHLHWTHGGKPFDQNNEDCQKQLNEWQEKAKTSQYTANAIQTWTVRDVEKAKCAKENNLNIEFIYNL